MISFGKIIKKLFKPRKLLNVFKRNHNKRALIVYVLDAFLIKRDSDEFRFHTNRWRNVTIAEQLDKLGYCVDVINYNDVDTAQKINNKYNLIFGLGEGFDYLIKNKANLFDKKVYFTTGSTSVFQNSQEQSRAKYFKDKYGIDLTLPRYSNEDNSIWHQIDSMLILGNEYSLSFFEEYSQPTKHVISSHAYDDIDFFSPEKDHSNSKKHFMFMTGKGKLLCGLDMIFEVFKRHPELTLHVCTRFNNEEDFLEPFKDIFTKHPNIVHEGWVVPNSNQFKEIVNTCSSIIMPVFSGGANGTVLIGMSHGLIPIISKEATVDILDTGILLSTNTEQEIEKAVLSITNKSDEEIKILNNRSYTLARSEYTQKRFVEKLNNIFKQMGI